MATPDTMSAEPLVAADAGTATLFAQTAARLRAGAGAGEKVVGRLSAGDRVTVLERSGDWLRVSERAWVHGNLVGAVYRPMPSIDQMPGGLRGLLYAVNLDRGVIAELIDSGWQGAVDGPQISLCVVELAPGARAISCVDNDFEAGNWTSKVGAQQRNVRLLWNAEGLSVQKLLAEHELSALTTDDPLVHRIAPEDAGLVLQMRTRKVNGERHPNIHRIRQRGKVVWNNDLDEGEAATLLRVLRFADGTVAAVLRIENLHGCCSGERPIVLRP